MLRQFINDNKIRWYDMEKLDERDKVIQRIMEQLDQVAVGYETKWGVGILQKYCAPALLDKWMRQCDKFKEAVWAKDVEMVRTLASGFKRAYDALECDIEKTGAFTIREVSFMASMAHGKEVLVCASDDDARVLAGKRKGEGGVDIWTIKQVASVLASKYDLIRNVEESLSTQVTGKELDPFDFDLGDSTDM